MCLWGIAEGIAEGALEALFADSIPTGERSYWYMRLEVVSLTTAAVGPAVSAIMFWSLGNHWTLEQMRPVLYTGLALQLPMIVMYFMVSDDDTVKKRKGRQKKQPTKQEASDTPSHDEYVRADSAIATDSDSECRSSDGDSECSSSDGDSDSGSSSEGGEGRVLQASSCWGWVTPTRIPYIIFIGDFLIQLGSGMTVKFFPLYFMNIVGLGPASVQLIYVVQPLLQAAITVVLQKASVWTGRVQTVLVSRIVGVSCLLSMAFLELRYREDGGWQVSWPILVSLYVIRTIGMNATAPLEDSLLMDYCPSDQRARWLAMESVAELNWCGSAAIGGYLADKYGYASTFLITAGMQCLGGSIYMLLLPMIPVESALRDEAEDIMEGAEEAPSLDGSGDSSGEAASSGTFDGGGDLSGPLLPP